MNLDLLFYHMSSLHW